MQIVIDFEPDCSSPLEIIEKIKAELKSMKDCKDIKGYTLAIVTAEDYIEGIVLEGCY